MVASFTSNMDRPTAANLSASAVRDVPRFSRTSVDLISTGISNFIFNTISDEEYMGLIRATGMPDFVAPFILKWVQGMNQGEWEEETRDLEGLIDRKPTTPAQYLSELSGIK